jgi:phosphatidate cytidylyltransferase
VADKRFETLPRRVLVAVVAIPSILWLSFEGGLYFFIFVALISALSLLEFYGLAEKKGAYPLKAFGIIGGFFVNFAFIYERVQLDLFQFFAMRGVRLSMLSQHQLLSVVLITFVLMVLVVELFRTKGSPFFNAGSTVLGVLAISLSFGTLIFTRELFPHGFPVFKFFSNAMPTNSQLVQINRWGGYTVISLFATIWMCDTAAYFGGTLFGKNKLFERVSPGKTWEGAFAGFIAAVLTMFVAQRMCLSYLSPAQSVLLGALVGVFGQVGDLIESRFKRDAEVKDSSSIIPGHGGVYDRFDSLVFVAPIVYLYIDFVVLS